jgi:hypothetical protein
MNRRAIAGAVLVLGCHYDTTVGHLRAPDGAAPADAVDVVDAGDAVDAVDAADAVDAPTPVDDPQREASGVGSLAPTVAADPRARADRFRIYYVDRAGQLWMERRVTATLARDCAQPLGSPEGRVLAGRPGAGDRPGQAVVAPVRGDDGRLQYWIREEAAEDGACGGAFSAWAALPRCPYELTSAPTVYQYPRGYEFDAGNAYVLGATRDGVAMLVRRPGEGWGAWVLAPNQPTDARVYGRPGLLEWGEQLELWTLATGASGRPRLLRTIYFPGGDRWLSAWLEEPLQADDPPASSVDARAFVPTAGMPQQWVAYMGASGRLWTRSYQSHGAETFWGTWSSVPAIPRGEIAAPPSAVSIGVARTTGATSELLITASPPDARALHVARWNGAASAFAPWAQSPDPLR